MPQYMLFVCEFENISEFCFKGHYIEVKSKEFQHPGIHDYIRNNGKKKFLGSIFRVKALPYCLLEQRVTATPVSCCGLHACGVHTHSFDAAVLLHDDISTEFSQLKASTPLIHGAVQTTAFLTPRSCTVLNISQHKALC